MEIELPQPTYRLDTPASGWWKAPSAIGTDPVFLRVEEEHRLAAVGVYIASIGWCLMHNSRDGWLPAAAVTSGQVIAGDREQLLKTAAALVAAGIWARANVDGLDGFVVAGASKAVEERFARQENARKAGQTSAQAKSTNSAPVREYAKRPGRIDANAAVDWSKQTGEL